MHFVVVGAGAVGGYFGGKLAQAGAPVTFLVREGRFATLSQRGLRVSSVHGDFVIKPTLATSVDAIADPTIVMLAVKNYHLQETLPQLAHLVKKGAKVIPLLNGVQHVDRLIEALGKDAVWGGCCYVEATLSPEGDILQTSPMQDVLFGPLHSTQSGLVDDVASWLERAAIPGGPRPNIMADLWTKYIFLTTLSAITTAARLPVGPLREDPVSSAFFRDMVREGFAVAKAYEPGIPDDFPDILLNRFASLSATMTSSMHRDLEKGMPLELEALQGALVELGRARGLDTPNFKAIYALLHPYLEGRND